ncbi:MAG: hypothetical protein COV67_11945 [Nitrospinae bacterium CG11_big_fil_rev_8_21_14_0_20_56_8]|nr:MAG: hypothetical protein COV67_11945 [Nitrospinae bacterium CG11_big_fil_rev_8_21_14_0_20_56_8]
MKSEEFYVGKEQTYLKHFFLERYIERVAFNIGSFENDFVYVDGFSGPWRSQDEAYEDTSFGIAIKKLRFVHDAYLKQGKKLHIRCLFIEKDGTAYTELKRWADSIEDFEAKSIHGEFENVIPQIQDFIGRSFSLIFIDPTGWKGFALEKIKPILKLRGEVIINFMFDYINRFLINDNREDIVATFNDLFGGEGYRKEYDLIRGKGFSEEEAKSKVYLGRLRKFGEFPHIGSFQILKPRHDRSFFYLLYGTRHIKGLIEFRKVEKRVFKKQNDIRKSIKHKNGAQGPEQLSFPGEEFSQRDPTLLERERNRHLEDAIGLINSLIGENDTLKYVDILGKALEIPFVYEDDVKKFLFDLKNRGKISFEGLNENERTLKWKSDHRIVRIS